MSLSFCVKNNLLSPRSPVGVSRAAVGAALTGKPCRPCPVSATHASLSVLPLPSRNTLSFAADVSRCVAERKYTQEQARKEFQQVFIPECSEDGTYSQVATLGTPAGVEGGGRGAGSSQRKLQGALWRPPTGTTDVLPGGLCVCGGLNMPDPHGAVSTPRCPRTWRGWSVGEPPGRLLQFGFR